MRCSYEYPLLYILIYKLMNCSWHSSKLHFMHHYIILIFLDLYANVYMIFCRNTIKKNGLKQCGLLCLTTYFPGLRNSGPSECTWPNSSCIDCQCCICSKPMILFWENYWFVHTVHYCSSWFIVLSTLKRKELLQIWISLKRAWGQLKHQPLRAAPQLERPSRWPLLAVVAPSCSCSVFSGLFMPLFIS